MNNGQMNNMNSGQENFNNGNNNGYYNYNMHVNYNPQGNLQGGMRPNPQMMGGPRPMGPNGGINVNPNMGPRPMNQNGFRPINWEECYVGKKHKKLSKGFFSIWTLLFGPFYFLYRKLYGIFAIWFVADVFLTYLIIKYGSLYVALAFIFGINFLMAFVFKYFYFSTIPNKVRKIRKKYGRYPLNQLMIICSKTGGTNTMGVFFLTIISLISIVTLTGVYFLQNPRVNSSNLSVRLNHKFELLYENDAGFSYIFDSLNINLCYVKGNIITEFTTIEDYYSSYLEGEDASAIKKVTINDTEWSLLVKKPNTYAESYYYATIKDNKLYTFDFIIANNTGEACVNYYNSAKKTLIVS